MDTSANVPSRRLVHPPKVIPAAIPAIHANNRHVYIYPVLLTQEKPPARHQKKRSLAAMVQVPLKNFDIWESWRKTPAPLSYGHWIAMDPTAAKLVLGGTHFLRSKEGKRQLAREVHGHVNFVDDLQANSEEDLSSITEDSDDYLFEDDGTSVSSEDDSESQAQHTRDKLFKS